VAPPSEAAPGEDRRDRRRRLVQDEIAQEAMKLFIERGYDGVSVDEIAVAVGMSQRSFFRYFGTKDEVLLRYRRSLRHRLVTHLRNRPEHEGPIEALRAAYLSSTHVRPADRADVRALGRLLADTKEIRARSLGENLIDDELIEEMARRMGVGRDDLRPAVFAAAISAAVDVGWNDWVFSSSSGDPSDRVAEAIDLLLSQQSGAVTS
jgi:AcrR family transcriptional regulator